jgi:hypothetical protein
MSIPKEICEKYNLDTLEEKIKNFGNEDYVKMDWYRTFLTQTDHITLKLVEGSVSSATSAEELKCREIARQEIAKIEGKPYKSKEGTPLDTYVFAMAGSANVAAAEQTRKALQLFCQTLDDDKALEVATVFPAYAVGRAYAVGDMFSYGENSTGDPQLYKVVQAHTSQEDWKPDATPSLYSAIGLTPAGYPIWNRPSGAHDAYGKGDIVSYKEKLYKSLIDGNTYSPDEYPAGWEEYIE